ncbi:hypothetical protein [Halobacillus litoralis]|uniref:hypothetical protein n=1 Tax=Halobacillus litoralis TaxID=45668 RepID=UPI001CFF0AFD|nr:hypothetical protein [Halobacillus litoralis]
MDETELPISGRYSVRIDKTIVVEPLRHLTEDTFRRILHERSMIQCIGIQTTEADVPELLKYDGPYSSERVNGILIFKRM